MTTDELKTAGRTLYGYGWQSKMARDINVNPTTVRRWVSGRIPVPGPVEAFIQCMLRARSEREVR
jgi:DNA-binding transcriptional regulator YdaS (Cro superfamily)